MKVRWLISEKRDEDGLKYTEQNSDDEFTVISDETEALEIPKNNNMTIN